MPHQYVIVLDLGSSALRAHAVPVERPWDIPPGAARTYGTRRQAGALARSISPGNLRSRMFQAVREAAHTCGASPRDIAAVAVTAQRGGAAFLDTKGKTLYLGPNKDLRAVFEGAEMDERHGQEIYAFTGHLPSMFFTPAKLRWWRAHRPGIFDRIAHVLTLGAWAVHELTGEMAETGPSLSESGLADIREVPAVPAWPLLRKLGMDPALVPRLVPTGTPAGVLPVPVADETGLPLGTPVYLAGPDAHVAMLGMGIVRMGDTGVMAGWSSPVQCVTTAPAFHVDRKTWAGPHVMDGRWLAEANPSDTGATVDAIRRLLRLSHARFHALAAEAGEAAQSTAAFWGPRALDLSAPGMSLGGLLLPVPMTHEGLEPGSVARATLENVAYAIRECLDTLDVVIPAAGTNMSETISLSGGMTRGRAFPAVLASAVGRPVRLHPPSATATGAAIIASRHPVTWPEAAKESAEQAKVLEPDARASLEYAELYSRWLRLRAALDRLADEL